LEIIKEGINILLLNYGLLVRLILYNMEECILQS
jgi:hypothetical protein